MPESVQQSGEKAAGKGVAGTDLLDHVQAQCRHVDPLVTVEPGDRVRVVLDDQVLGLGEQRAQLRGVVGAEYRQRLVGAQENDIAVPGVSREHVGRVSSSARPTARAGSSDRS